MSRAGLEDERLSWKARGLLAYLLSKPDNWQVMVAHLVNQGPDGRGSVMSGLRELKDAGYIVSSRARAKGGTFDGWDSTVYEEPVTESRFPDSGCVAPSTEVGKTDVGKTDVGKTATNEELLLTKNKETTSDVEDARPEATRLATLLADLIEANGSKRPSVSKAWITEIDRMLRLDNRDPVKAERLMRWCQADEFWRANVLSAAKFRAKYDQMRLRANAEAKKAGEPAVDNSHSPRQASQPPPVDDLIEQQRRAHAESVPMPAFMREWKRKRGRG